MNVYAIDLSDKNINPVAKFSNFASLANLILPNLLIGAGVILFIMFIMAGFTYMGSDGNPEKLKKAQMLLTFSVVGFALVLASFIIIRVIASIFRITLPF